MTNVIPTRESAAATSVLSCENLIKNLSDGWKLGPMSFAIAPGDIVGLVGRNGAGKTTLLELLLGLVSPDYGASHIWDEPTQGMSDRNKARLAYVPQTLESFGWMRGLEFMKLVAKLYPKWRERFALELLMRWNVPLARRIDQMSVGERQRLHIVRALASQPELLVLDEPVASLDPAGRRAFLREIVALCAPTEDVRRVKTTVLFSTHIISDLERCANKIAVLNRGELVYFGELDRLKEGLRCARGLAFNAEMARAIPGFLHFKLLANKRAQAIIISPETQSNAELSRQLNGAVVSALTLEDLLVELAP
jgi:ABC-2 type transport system ATP-binding protein